jgi:hypothetical protein
MGRRGRDLALTAVAALAVLVAGHNLVFLLTYGADYGSVLVRTGHDSRWNETVRVVLITATLLAMAATVRLAYLYGLLRRLHASAGRLSGRAYVGALIPIWVRLFVIATLLFVLQENYERWAVGLQLPGFAVLASFGIAGPVLVFLLVSLLVAAVAALFQWSLAALEARIAEGRARRSPSAPVRYRQAEPLRPPSSNLGRNLAGRAPPAPLTAH